MGNRALLFLVLVLSAGYVHATDFPSAACSNNSGDSAKIQAAITAATTAGSGNSVSIPAGTCRITSTFTNTSLQATKSITIRGAGVGSTILIRPAAAGFGELGAFYVNGNGTTFDLSGMTCRWEGPDPDDTSAMCFQIDVGTTETAFFRVHNMSFENIEGRAMDVYAHGVIANGLFDHNDWANDPDYGHAQMVSMRNCASGFTSEDAVMSTALEFGTAKAIYFENNNINFTKNQDSSFESYSCGRFVIRFNHVHGAPLGFHGAEGERGTQSFEEYYNLVDIKGYINYTTGTNVGPFTISAALNNNTIRMRTNTPASQKTIPDGTYTTDQVVTWINANYPTIIASNVSEMVRVGSRTDGVPISILAMTGGAGSVYSTLGNNGGVCTGDPKPGFCLDTYGDYSGKFVHVRSASGFIFNNTLSADYDGGITNTVYRASNDNTNFTTLPNGPCIGTYLLTVNVQQNWVIGPTNNIFAVTIDGVSYQTTLDPPGSRTAASLRTEINAEVPQVTITLYGTGSTKMKLGPTSSGVLRLAYPANEAMTTLGWIDNMDTNTGVGTPYGGAAQYPARGYACLDSPGWYFNRWGGYTANGGVATRAPNYYFLNRRAGANFAAAADNDSGGVVAAEHEWFNENGSVTPTCTMTVFNGTCGVGVGLKATMTAIMTCTENVGFWVTNEGTWNHNTDPEFSSDQGQLYKCGASNNWVLYYTPYTYPHPMSSGVSISDISPAEGQRNSTVPITITGLGLNAASPLITVSGTGLTVSSLMVASDTSVTANFVMTAGATLGDRDVYYSNASGVSNTKTFTVLGADAPILDTINPGSGYRGTAPTITITGSDMAGSSPSLTTTCNGVTVSNLVVGGPTSLTATFTIAVDAAISACEVTLTTTDGPSNTLPFQPLATGSGSRGRLTLLGGK